MKTLHIIQTGLSALLLTIHSLRAHSYWSPWEDEKGNIVGEEGLQVGNIIDNLITTEQNESKLIRGKRRQLNFDLNIDDTVSKTEDITRFLKKRKRPSKKYKVVIKKGHGKGKYSKGDIVNIEAKKQKKKIFMKWKIINGPNGIIDDLTSGKTILIMPKENIKIKAIYSKNQFTLTIRKGEDGFSDRIYSIGEVVAIDAAPPSKDANFLKWSVGIGPNNIIAEPLLKKTTLTMPSEDVTVEAKFNTHVGVKYDLDVRAGSGIGTYAEGTLVNIIANDPADGSIFRWWVVTKGSNDGIITNPSLSMTTLRMPNESVRIEAQYFKPEFYLQVVNGKGSGKFDQGTAVSIVADAPPPGLKFRMWSITKGSLDIIADTTSEATILTNNRNEDVEITAEYTENVPDNTNGTFFDLIVTNGHGGGRYKSDSTIVIRKDGPSGSLFRWLIITGVDGIINDPNSQITTLTMPNRNVTIMGLYTLNPGFMPTFQLDVEKGEGGGLYRTGSLITVTADVAQTGYIFARWKITKGSVGMIADLLSPITTVFVDNERISIKAVFSALT